MHSKIVVICPQLVGIQAFVYRCVAAFRNTAITQLILPNSVTEVGYNIFRDCKSLKTVTIGNGLTGLSSGMFKIVHQYKKLLLTEYLRRLMTTHLLDA